MWRKRKILLKRERALRSAITSDRTQRELEKYAERVRLAQLGVLKDKYSYLPQHLRPTEKSLYWSELDVEKIIELYR